MPADPLGQISKVAYLLQKRVNFIQKGQNESSPKGITQVGSPSVGLLGFGPTQVGSPSLGLLGLGPKGPNLTGPDPRQTRGDHPLSPKTSS